MRLAIDKIRQEDETNAQTKNTVWRKNLTNQRLIELRKLNHLSHRDLSRKLQLAGYDMGKNVITRAETNSRYVTDIEARALAQIFNVNCDYLINGDSN